MSSIHKIFKNNFLNFIVISLPLFFVLGPALLEVTSLIFFLFFISIYIKEDKKLNEILKENKNYINLFVLFWFFLLISSFNSENYYLSFKNTGFYFRFLIFSLVILYCLYEYKKLHYYLLYIYFILLAIIFLSSIYEVVTGNNLFSNLPTLQGRITSVFVDEQILGSFIVKSMPLILGLIYFSDIKFKFLVIFLLITVCLVLIILSGERAALALFLILSLFSLKIKAFRRTFYLLAVIGISIYIISPKLIDVKIFDRITTHTMKQIGLVSLANNERLRLFSSVHEYHYISALKMFVKNPFLGIGPNNFRDECKKDIYEINSIPFMETKILAKSEGYFVGKRGEYFQFYVDDSRYLRSYKEIDPNYKLLDNKKVNIIKKPDGSKIIQKHFDKDDHIFSYKNITKISGCNTHPHNYITQFLSETGIFGLTFYLILLSSCFYRILQIIFTKKTDYYPEYFLLISILLSLFPFLPSGNFFNNMNSFMIFWNLPFFIYLKKIRKDFK